MRYGFADIEKDEIISNSDVLFVIGPHDVFNNSIVDRMRNFCYKEENKENVENSIKEFGITEEDEERYGNNIDLDTFFEVSSVPSVVGLWYTRVDLDVLDNKRKVKLKNYVKRPNKYGKIIAVSKDFRNYKEFMELKELTRTTNINSLQLRYPNKRGLSSIVANKFMGRGFKQSEDTLRYFVMIMSTSYDRYDEVIDNLCRLYGWNGEKPDRSREFKYKSIPLDIMKKNLKDEANFLIDDLIREIVKPMNGNKLEKRRKVYKIYGALADSMGDTEIIKQLRYRIDDILSLRVLINLGVVPIMAKYSVTDIQNKMADNNKLKKLNEYRFRILANIASMTSVEDWQFIKMVLMRVNTSQSNDVQSFRVIYNLLHRSILDISRVQSDLNKNSALRIEVDNLDKVVYDESKLITKSQKYMEE